MNIDEILEAHKLWLQSHGKDGVRANLSGADLSGTDLGDANLSNADLSGADLGKADLAYANLNGADLSGTDLGDADLRWANLNGADLSGTDLREADLSYADLKDANLSNADLRWANLRDADLRGAKLPDKTFLIYGEVYPIFIMNGECLGAGCEYWHINKWREFTLEEIEGMDGDNAVKFYPRLLDILDLYCGPGERPRWVKEINREA